MPAATMVLVMLSSCPIQQPDPGISSALARERANRVSKVAYELTFHCAPRADKVRGTVRLLFDLPDAPPKTPVVLDFRGDDLGEVSVNGVEITEIRQRHNHVLLPPDALNPGRNEFNASFTSRVAATGTPLSSYRDATHDEEFVYTLLVPADAHGLFPCFDQPDLKATFRLRLHVPKSWTAVANAPRTEEPEPTEQGQVFTFAETPALPTYLFAFAAGPFEVVAAEDSGRPPLRIFVRNSKRRDMDAPALLAMHSKSVTWLESYFARDYPFKKLDIVLLPGFPYGGMEHAGAIFYRESALVFDHPPTESELIRRSTLIYHEVSHQWFGNLVTMQWFDDLWLKEGFATYVGYRLLDVLEPERHAWLRFLQRVKPRAYRIDVTKGTTPVYQQLDNLADAKSAYGAIVYNKAPAVLRELQGRVGERAFRGGMQAFLAKHAFG